MKCELDSPYIKYPTKGGAKRIHILVNHSDVFSLPEARAMDLEIELESAQGIDRVAIAEEKRFADEAVKSSALTIRQVLKLYDQPHLSNLKSFAERKRQIEQSLSKKMDSPKRQLKCADLKAAVDEKASAGRGIYANRIMSALMAFTHWASRRDHLETDIGHNLTKETKEESRERTPSRDEIQAILAATFDIRDLWGPTLRLLILTAPRRQEIFGLRCS